MRPTYDEIYSEMARLIAQRSTCPRANVGAVLVDARNRIIGTGYNGSPTGQAFARAQVGKVWPRSLDRSATQLLPRRVGEPFSCGEGTRRQAQARAQTLWVAGSADAGSQLLLGPGT